MHVTLIASGFLSSEWFCFSWRCFETCSRTHFQVSRMNNRNWAFTYVGNQCRNPITSICPTSILVFLYKWMLHFSYLFYWPEDGFDYRSWNVVSWSRIVCHWETQCSLEEVDMKRDLSMRSTYLLHKPRYLLVREAWKHFRTIVLI
jgi:hypothetical protein